MGVDLSKLPVKTLVTNQTDASRRATRAVIDLDAIAGNVRAFREIVGPSVQLMAVVKANGYGHGAVMIARTAIGAGADQLAVATVDEGMQLRQAGTQKPILVLGPVSPEEISSAIRNELQLSIGSTEQASAFSESLGFDDTGFQLKVHLKIDTGMSRYGSKPENALSLAQYLNRDPRFNLAGVFTHFASADEEDERPTQDQAELFDSAIASLRKSHIDPGTVHAANSAATLRSPRYHFDMVRIGISMYGIAPSAVISLPEGFQSAMAIRSRIGRVFDLAPGDKVSYGGTYVATAHERAALVPIGYADGYRRGLSGKAWMSVAGTKCPVLGRVCMDQTVIRIPNDQNIREQDEVLVAGSPEAPSPSFDELAEIVDTIPYEIATGITRRVPRIYVDHGEIVGVEDLQGLHKS
jgi:alanine racemase